jgi:hypothetical protein
LIDELLENKKLLKAGEGDSSGGSDSEPSEDNLPIEEVAMVVPMVEKKQIQKLEKAIKKRQDDEAELKKGKEKPPTKKKFDEIPSPTKLP